VAQEWQIKSLSHFCPVRCPTIILMSEKVPIRQGGASSISSNVKIGTEWAQPARGEQESNKRLLEIAQGLLPSY